MAGLYRGFDIKQNEEGEWYGFTSDTEIGIYQTEEDLFDAIDAYHTAKRQERDKKE